MKTNPSYQLGIFDQGGQTDYPTAQGQVFAGVLADTNDAIIEDGVSEEAAAIPFGLGMRKGAAARGFLLPTANTDVIQGISVHRHAINTLGISALDNGANMPAGDHFDLLVRGRIFVKVEEAITGDGTEVAYCRSAANGLNTQLGAFRKSADGGNTIALRGARFPSQDAVAAGGIAVLEFDGLVATTVAS